MNNVLYSLQLQSDTLTTATQNNVLIRYSMAIQSAPVSQITGFQVALNRKVFWFQNQSGADITMKHASTSSAFGNRLFLPNATDFVLTSGSTAQFFYDEGLTSWFLMVQPDNGIKQWIPQEYDKNDQANYNNILWIANADTISTDIPGISTKWNIVGDLLKLATYAEADIETTLTWDGTPPSGTITKKYVGNRTVTGYTQAWFKIRATVAGAGNGLLSFPLPSGLPTPAIWASQPNNEIVSFGIGAFSPAAGQPTYAGAYIMPVAGVYTVFLSQPFTGTAAISADLSINYFS